jgi:hypothetical protein
MKPLIHAKASAAKYGGTFEDYLPLHDFMDSSKAAVPDVRHRAVFHSAFGIFVVEQVFGTFITNSAGKQVSVRDIAEDHVIEDLGTIPTLEQWFVNMPIEGWMGGKSRKVRRIALEDLGRDTGFSETNTPVADGRAVQVQDLAEHFMLNPEPALPRHTLPAEIARDFLID